MGKTLGVGQLGKLYLGKNKGSFVAISRTCLFFVCLLLSSCYTSKGVNYLQSKKESMSIPVKPTEYLVQPNDILSIKVQSRDPEQADFFNLTSVENRNIQANPASLFLTGYTVNEEGMINLAIVGELKVSDLSVEEIRDLVQDEIDKYLLNATVSVALTSFKISVLGDVKNPGTNYVYNRQSTIFEALSAAGDLNFTAKRKKIKLIRQVGDVVNVVNLDLRDPDIIKSPYYFLHPNDVIYVDTSRQRVIQNNIGVFGILLSAITTTILILQFNN